MEISGFNLSKDEHLNISYDKIEEFIVIKLAGRIDTYNHIFFIRKVQLFIDNGIRNVILDLSKLNYLSSTGIGSIITFYKSLEEVGGQLVICNIPEKIKELFKLLGFINYFNIVNSLDESISFLEGEFKIDKNEGPFPKISECVICDIKLNLKKIGKFRCSECKTVVVVNDEGNILLG
jgi:anti-anti-sigma factor